MPAAVEAQHLCVARDGRDVLRGLAFRRAGRFGFVVGVDRSGQDRELRAHGADIAVADLAELLDTP